MPYAANRVVSTEPFDGAIEITEGQYREAVEGMCEGMMVSIDDGFTVAFPSPEMQETFPERIDWPVSPDTATP
jgi:hypothetical protein